MLFYAQPHTPLLSCSIGWTVAILFFMSPPPLPIFTSRSSCIGRTHTPTSNSNNDSGHSSNVPVTVDVRTAAIDLSASAAYVSAVVASAAIIDVNAAAVDVSSSIVDVSAAVADVSAAIIDVSEHLFHRHEHCSCRREH